jgi:hypothetical protein
LWLLLAATPPQMQEGQVMSATTTASAVGGPGAVDLVDEAIVICLRGW